MISYSVGNVKHLPKIFSFPAGEVGVSTHYDAASKDKELVKVDACLTSSDEIIQLFMLTDALKRQYVNSRFELNLGYVPYGRQDRVCNEGESLSIKVFADMINSLNYSLVTITDPHSDVTGALFNNVKIVSQKEIFDKYFLRKLSFLERDVLIAPDIGAAKKANEIFSGLKMNSLMVANKQRDLATGYITDFEFSGDVEGKHCVVVDDICDGGATFILIGKALRERGAKSITLCVTHGIFSKGHEVVANLYDKVYTTNSYHKNRVGLVDGVTYIEII